MEEKRFVNSYTNTCSFAGIKPIMVDLPYPPVMVRGKEPGLCQSAQRGLLRPGV